MAKLSKIIYISLFTAIWLYCFFTNNKLCAVNVHENNKNTLEFVKSPDLKTVKLHRMGWELSEPTLELFSSDKLLFTFDDLSENPGVYGYTLTHCDSDWNPTPIFYSDYMDGFKVNEIRDYSLSMGSIISYVHFRLEIPNQDVKLKISGNYILRVFDVYKSDDILIQRKFIIYEPLVAISASIRQPSAGEQRYSGQQMELKVNTSTLRVTDPNAEIRTKVCQNYLFQGCYQGVKPVFVRGNEIDYSNYDALIFTGGNEFRIFDTKNIRYQAQGVHSVEYIGGMFHVQLTPDQNRRRHRYSFYSDLNGRYVVNLERSTQSHLEADYVWVYFTLTTPMELDEGKSVYLFGEFTNWQLSPENRLVYNNSRGAYELRLLLKQGAYSYRYVVANDKTGEVDISHYEGSHFDTENNYMVVVYYKPLGARYERAVGYSLVSTRR